MFTILNICYNNLIHGCSISSGALNAFLVTTITSTKVILILHAITIVNALELKSVAIITDTENAFIHIIMVELSRGNEQNLYEKPNSQS